MAFRVSHRLLDLKRDTLSRCKAFQGVGTTPILLRRRSLEIGSRLNIHVPHNIERRRRCEAKAISMAAQTTQHVNLWPMLVSTYATDPVGVLLAIGAFLAAIAFAVVAIVSIPTILAIRRSAVSLELLLRSMQDELPDTAAAVRLSSLEIADAIEEVTGLGSDISAGIRASARAIVEAEEGVKGAGKLITSVVLPSVKSKVPEAREKVEDALKKRAALGYTEPTLQEAAAASKVAIQRMRMALDGASLMSTALKKLPRRKKQTDDRLLDDRSNGYQ